MSEKQHWAAAVIECVSDNAERERLIRMYDYDELVAACLALGTLALSAKVESAKNVKLTRERDRAIGALGNIRTVIDGKIDVNHEGDGPNIFGQIDNECAVGLGEAP